LPDGRRSVADIPSLPQSARMTGYDEVDAIIDAWAKANVKKLFDEWAGKPARFAYLPGKRALECFQISIQLPSAGRIVVSAHSVDTDDDSEHHQSWEGPVDSLAAMLEKATDVVRIWVNRPSANGS
jgi:hypothetical protein